MTMQWTRVVSICLGLTCLAGCGSRPDRSDALAQSRRVHVTPSISGNLTDASFRMEPALQGAVARTLGARGYVVGPEADADAVVRVAWILGRDIAPDGKDERTLGLSLSIFSRSGQRLYSARSPQTWPERMWSDDRVTTEIARLLAGLPEATKATLAPAEGKPAMAPIRLK